MVLVAPPEPQASGDDEPEAVIKEARQRARRRRWMYFAAAILFALALAGAFFARAGGTPAAHGAGRRSPTPPKPLGAPLVEGSDAASTVVASKGMASGAFVFVYADGRVVWHGEDGVVLDHDGSLSWFGLMPAPPDSWLASQLTAGLTYVPALEPGFGRYGHPALPQGDFGYAIVEARLSAFGLERLRAGEITAWDLMWNTEVWGREELWASSAVEAYEPSAYAICSFSEGQRPGATRDVGLLPASAQELLHGKERIFDPNIGTDPWWGPLPLMDCFEVTAAEASTLHEILDTSIDPNPPGMVGWFANVGESLWITAAPIYPHGQPVVSGG